MINNSENQKIFTLLRGYYDKSGYHPMGREGATKEELLSKLNFSNQKDFIDWYNSLDEQEIKEYKKDWCSGDCCQSLLKELLKI
jgi:hypothetical protein